MYMREVSYFRIGWGIKSSCSVLVARSREAAVTVMCIFIKYSGILFQYLGFNLQFQLMKQ